MMINKFNLTLAVLKPSVVARPYAIENIVDVIKKEGLYIVRRKQILLDKQTALQFYKEHEGKFFYNRLVTYMASGPLIAMALAGNDAIQRWRNLMGPTKVYKTQYESPSSIRGSYGISDTRNATHGSDSAESAHSELKFFFPEFDVSDWYMNHEELFRQGRRVYFDEAGGVHYCDNKESQR